MNATKAAVVALGAGVLGGLALRGRAPEDLPWQAALGAAIVRDRRLPDVLGTATFSAPAAPWLPHEWLFALAWSAVHGPRAAICFALALAACASATLVITVARAPRSGPAATALVLALLVAAMWPAFGLRAQVVGWPLFALALWALERGGRRAWFAVPATVGWVNVHAGAAIVPALALLAAAGTSLESRRPRGIALVAALAGAVCLTPFGWQLPLFALRWSLDPATAAIVEWQPVGPATFGFALPAFALAALVLAGERRGIHLGAAQRLSGCALFVAALAHERNLVLFCIAAAPWALRALASRAAVAPAREPFAWGMAAAGLAGGVVCAAIAVQTPAVERARSHALDASVALVGARPGPTRVACEDFAWCSRFASAPRVRVLMDGRTDAYPAAVFASFADLRAGRDVTAIATRWSLDCVLARRDGALARALRVAGWRRLNDAEPQVFVRRGDVAQREPA